ncbi:zinc-binding alcohol dehydrogenase family protein [Streptomyces sp. NPDC004520]|uniref:zinc-binding alcohol dehydrogenase family protein n=1 Tax=Streptomyces sp. NPDC004520 TaxID=3364702 RepID=UPI003686B6CA
MEASIPETMAAWVVSADHPGGLERAELPVPVPAPGELLVRVRACGVCRTDLHVRDHDLLPHRDRVVPGHEAVGEVVATGGEATGPGVGGLIGIPWLRGTCGACPYCTSGRENLCLSSRYTGWDADGGYAEYATVPADHAYEMPTGYSAEELAPLLCAGIIGYRALRRADLPAGGRLGVYGFGGSAHLTAQLALAEGATVHVLTRSPAAQALALELGATSARDARTGPPEPLDAAILFAPVGPSSRWPWRHWPAAEPSPSRASTCPTSRHWTTRSTSSGNGPSAASPPTPARTAAPSWPPPPDTGYDRRSPATTSPTPTRP